MQPPATIRLLWLIPLLAACWLAGCDESLTAKPTGRPIPPSTEVWVASEMASLTDQTPRFEDTAILSTNGDTVLLAAAANETISFQLIIDAPAAGLPGVRVLPDTLVTDDQSKKLPAETFHLFRQLPIAVKNFPAWYLRISDQAPTTAGRYDPLVPIDAPGAGQPYRLGCGERLAVWVDLAVPRDAKAGVYHSAIRIDTGALEGYRFDVELTVHDFVLPDERIFAAAGGFSNQSIFREFITRNNEAFVPTNIDITDPNTAQGVALLRSLVTLAHEHRLDLFDKTLRPRIRRNAQGLLSLDWTSYDQIVIPFLDGSAFADHRGVSAWPIPYDDDWPKPEYYGGYDSPNYRATAKEVVALAGRHFRSLGADDQMFAWPLRSERATTDVQRFETLADILHQADPGVPVLATIPTTPPKESNLSVPDTLSDQIDILAPPARWLNPAEAVQRRKPERPLDGVWLQPGDVPYLPSLSIFASPADVRAIPWFVAKYQCTGLFLPEVLHWQGDVLHASAGEETRLFYPGTSLGLKQILPSVRLKRFRRGMQDVAYLWLLQQHQREGIARAICNAMVRYACLDATGDHYLDARIDGWVKNGTAWIEARQLLAEEVRQALHPQPRNDRERIADQVRWRRFTDLTSTLAVERVQSYVRGSDAALSNVPDQPGDSVQNINATILASLYNEFDRSLEVKVRTGTLPKGWSSVIGEHTIPRFEPAAQREAKLVIEGMDVPVTPDGKIPLTMEVSAEPTTSKVLKTEVAFIIAGRFNTPPTIDGRLDDWPIRPRASAGNFKLLGRRGQGTSENDTGLAQRQTFAFAMQDDKYLYFGFRCEEPDVDGMVVFNDNRVRYEQLLACNEDLVEILLDPGAKAAGAEDLYHILVKPNAATVQEIGVRTDPPLGRARPFPLGAQVAVDRQKNSWSVEIAIPRSAFGADGAEPFWGVNFTRFAPQGMEASSWSGASRYFYDPRSLGTMYIPPPEHRIIPANP